MLVRCVLFDGFGPLDIVAPFEIIGTAAEFIHHPVAVELVSAEGPREVPSAERRIVWRERVAQ